MVPSSILLRLHRDTQAQKGLADEDRLQLLVGESPDRYTSFLARIWGFEAPLEAAFAKTPGLADIVDLRGRTHIRLLRGDLAALGITCPSTLPSCRTLPGLQVPEALRWMYVVEHNALLHGQLRRQLAKRLPKQLASAGSYLCGGERSVSARRLALGVTIDKVAITTDVMNRIVEGARVAFQHQRQWFRTVAPSVVRRSYPFA